MTMQELSRLILGLQAAGWNGDEINNLLLWIESGDEHYKPTQNEPKPKA